MTLPHRQFEKHCATEGTWGKEKFRTENAGAGSGGSIAALKMLSSPEKQGRCEGNPHLGP